MAAAGQLASRGRRATLLPLRSRLAAVLLLLAGLPRQPTASPGGLRDVSSDTQNSPETLAISVYMDTFMGTCSSDMCLQYVHKKVRPVSSACSAGTPGCVTADEAEECCKRQIDMLGEELTWWQIAIIVYAAISFLCCLPLFIICLCRGCCSSPKRPD